jgi:hypothetical protein
MFEQVLLQGAGHHVPRRLLVVTTAPDPQDELQARLRAYAGEDVEALVVAPVSDISPLQWLTGEEDEARREAQRRARQAAEDVPGQTVDARVGDPDPLVAVEDALRTLPADELIVVTRPEAEASWLEQDAFEALERFDLPVTHLVDDGSTLTQRPVAAAKPVPEPAREIVRGRSPWTGFLVEQAVLVVVATTAAVLIAVALILYFSLR